MSNFSQAIRFLVDNDFLKDVELKPGDADSQKIQVISDEAATDRSRASTDADDASIRNILPESARCQINVYGR